MARLVRGHLTPWQPEGTGEPETKPSVPKQEKQPDTTEGEVIEDYEPVAQTEEEENSNAEYVKMKIPLAGSPPQRMVLCSIIQRIQWVH